MKQGIYWIGSIIIIALALSYVFFSADLIPDAAVSVVPGTLIGWLDDAGALVGMFIALSLGMV